MGTKSKIAAIIFNIFSFVLFVMAMLPSNWSNGDGNGGGITVGFAFWVYSVIFALISTLLYIPQVAPITQRTGPITMRLRLTAMPLLRSIRVRDNVVFNISVA